MRGGQKSVERDIMQVECVMAILTLRIHTYSIIDEIVGIKFHFFLLKKGTNFNHS